MKKITIVFLFTYSLVILKSFSQTQFQRSIDFGNDDYGNQIANYNGNNFIIGSTNSTGAGGYDAMLLKTDSIGNVLFQKQFGGSSTEFGTKLKITSAGKIIGIGRSNSFSTTANHDFFVFQCDENGTLEWSTVFGTDSLEYAFAIDETGDGGFAICGQTKTNDKFDILLVKINSAGTVQWAKTIGNPLASEVVYDIKALGSDGFALFGFSSLGSIGINEAMILFVDTSGNYSRVNIFGGTGDDDIRNFANGSQNSFYTAGNTRSFGAGLGDFFLAKFDVSSFPPSLIWFKTYGGALEESFSSIVKSDSNFVLSGFTQSFGSGDNGIVIKVDSEGEVIWAGSYGDNGSDLIQCVANNPSGGYFLAGFSNSFGGTANNIFILNTDSLGFTGCNFNSISLSASAQVATFVDTITSGFVSFTPPDFAVRTANVIQNSGVAVNNLLCSNDIKEEKNPSVKSSVYPNPANDILYFDFSGNEKGNIKILNSAGIMIESNLIHMKNNHSVMDVSSFSPGIYMVIFNSPFRQIVSRFSIIR